MRTVDPMTWSKTLQKRLRRPSSSEQPTRREGLETRVRGSLRDAAREFWLNFSLRGHARTSEVSITKLERWQRRAVWVAAVWWGVLAVAAASLTLHEMPMRSVTQREAQVPIHRVPFPAVAICSNNIIARDQLHKFTTQLIQSVGNSSYSEQFVEQNVLQLGALLTLDLPIVDLDFQGFLRLALPVFNTTMVMQRLSPQCDQILKRCSWRGKVLACDRLFSSRLTPLGFCCVFNGRYFGDDVHRPAMFLDRVGHDFGLTAVVHEDPHSFTRLRRASVGIDVLVWDGRDYPLVRGGGVRLVPVQQETVTLVALRVTTQRGEALRYGCLRHERGYPWCLAECRRRTLAALCSCRLHTLLPADDDDMPLCSLMDLPCLSKHKEKLVYYYPYGQSSEALEEELQNGQQCPECAPDCARLVYSAAASVARYRHHMMHKHFKRHYAQGITLANSTAIRLFYTSKHQTLNLVEPTKRWYQSVAKLGSTWISITGISLMAAVEVVFYLTVRWMHHFRRRSALPPAPPIAEEDISLSVE